MVSPNTKFGVGYFSRVVYMASAFGRGTRIKACLETNRPSHLIEIGKLAIGESKMFNIATPMLKDRKTFTEVFFNVLNCGFCNAKVIH
jgi:hypothetical protein